MINKILLVDDDSLIRWSLQRVLEEESCKVIAAENAEKALEKIKETYFDVIITDLMMPGISGLELLKEIRKFSPQSQVIVITAYGSPMLAEEAKGLGACYFIDKPLVIEEMKAIVKRTLRKGGVLMKDYNQMTNLTK